MVEVVTMLLDKYISVKRLTPLQNNSDKEDFQVITGLQAVRANIQPSNAETVALVEGVFGKTYTIYTTISGIRDGDLVTVSGTFVDGLSQNKQLRVANVGNWSFPPMPHFEITALEIES